MSIFDDVIGHGPVVEFLEGEVARPAAAYLFVGAAGVGKGTVARRFAARLVGGGNDLSEHRALRGSHPDVVLVEPEGRSALTVDQARSTVARSALSPVEADRKVFVFEEAGAMNEQAANALLKTLEEPGGTSVFVLVTDGADDLPATVASRSRSVLFGRVTDDEITGALVARGVEREQAERAATTSGGRPGLALMLATRPDVAEFRRAWLSVPLEVDERPGYAFHLADRLVDAAEPLLEGLAERHSSELAGADIDGREVKAIKERHERERKRAAAALHVGGLEILASWYRDAASAQYGGPVRNRDVAGTDLSQVPAREAVAKAQRVLKTVLDLEANQRPELAFAALFSELGAPG